MSFLLPALVLLLLIGSRFVRGDTLESFPCDICKSTEVLSDTIPCCEPTCDNDCSLMDCPPYAVYKPSCVCREGYVRYQGECIPKCECPASDNIPLICPPHEELQPTPACCEPTCSNDCSNFVCRLALIHRPTCVCERGYVRHEGRCIKPDQCPTCGPYARYSNCTPCCESTCDIDCALVLCLAPCQGSPTCLCQPGYVKYRGVCIKKELCPRSDTVLVDDQQYDEDPECNDDCTLGNGDPLYQQRPGIYS